MEHQLEETPAALQRLWNLTRARLAGTSTALDEMPELVESLPSAQVRTAVLTPGTIQRPSVAHTLTISDLHCHKRL